MTLTEAGNRVSILFPGHGMQSTCKLTWKLYSLLIKKQNMKTKESTFVCNQNTFTSGVHKCWEPGRLNFVCCRLIYSQKLLLLILSHVQKYVSVQMYRARKSKPVLRPTGHSITADSQHGTCFTSPSWRLDF
jgi:uncharacterized protein (DUF2062 family)